MREATQEIFLYPDEGGISPLWGADYRIDMTAIGLSNSLQRRLAKWAEEFLADTGRRFEPGWPEGPGAEEWDEEGRRLQRKLALLWGRRFVVVRFDRFGAESRMQSENLGTDAEALRALGALIASYRAT